MENMRNSATSNQFDNSCMNRTYLCIPNTDHRCDHYFCIAGQLHICERWEHTGEREMHVFVYIWTLFKTIRSLWIGVENWSIVFAFGWFVFDLYFLSLFRFHEIEIHLLKAILDFRPLEVISWHPESIETWSRFSFSFAILFSFLRSCTAAFMIHFMQWSTRCEDGMKLT